MECSASSQISFSLISDYELDLKVLVWTVTETSIENMKMNVEIQNIQESSKWIQSQDQLGSLMSETICH